MKIGRKKVENYAKKDRNRGGLDDLRKSLTGGSPSAAGPAARDKETGIHA